MSPSSFKIIAIDGGAASGKSSTAQAVAERLGLLYADTGTHYRAITFLCLSQGHHTENPDAIAAYLKQVPLETKISGHRALICLNHHLPTENELRSFQVNAQVSHFAALPAVRQFLFAYQRNLVNTAREQGLAGLIMEGRDIGSAIFPHADLKFFLDANPKTRALRRAREGQQDSIVQRDQLDASRQIAPLLCPPDAIKIDTSDLPLEAVVEEVCRIIEAHSCKG